MDTISIPQSPPRKAAQLTPETASASSTSAAHWVDSHGDSLYRYALARVKDRHVAEDLVQESLLAALQARNGFAGRSSERTWLISILKHKLIDHFRKAGRERVTDTLTNEPNDFVEPFLTEGKWQGHWSSNGAPRDWGANPETDLERKEFWDVLKGCLENIQPRAARVFWLREVEGLGTEEICKEMNCTPTNLWVMLHRVRTQLRQDLEEQWFGIDNKRP